MNRLWFILGAISLGLVLLLASGDTGTVLGIEDDRFADLLYIGILGSVIGVGIVTSGTPLSYITRNLAIWAVFILALVAGYQYRYELQDVGSRLTAGLIPGSPLSMVDSDGRAAVMVDRGASGHFAVRVEIDGTSVMTMIDTGATTTVLTANDARSVGYDPSSLAYDVPIMTANGEARAALVTAEEIRVGSIARQNMQLLVAEPGMLDRSLLGMNFIGTLSGFDMRGERLILRD